MKKRLNSTMFVLMLVMVVNALSYGVMIPLMYPYASRFGIDAFTLGFLFASFSLFQFIATPIIGRLSDRFGRKPLLLISLFGTSLSLAFFALAGNIWQLFLARILDGITGGNMSVAQAAVADSTDLKDRAKYFGMLGASFGVGFLLGPALGGLLVTFGITTPFWVAAAIALFGVILGVVLLPETLPPEKRQPSKKPIFNFLRMGLVLFTPNTGRILLVTLLAAIGMNAFIIGFQSVTVDVLMLSAQQIAMLFTVFGFVSILMQSVGIRIILKYASSLWWLIASLLASAVVLFLMGFATSFWIFAIVLVMFMFIPAQSPFLSELLSHRTRVQDQGGMFGFSQSYTSLGQIIGPLLAAFIVRVYIPGAFWLAGAVFLVAMLAARTIPQVMVKQSDL